MKIQFIGAAGEVTGSCTLLEVNGRYYLIDCGMEQGLDVLQNVPLPIPAAEIDAIFLTHAHIDHSGMLPRLYKEGFRGIIFATEATVMLCDIMLRDSAHIQMLDAEWKNRKAARAGEPTFEPSYDLADAIGTLKLMRGVAYGQTLPVAAGVDLRFTDIGHLMGSAAIELSLKEGEVTRKIVFSGDVGNLNQPLINDPLPVKTADYLVLEATYGNRTHAPAVDTVESLAAYIDDTLARGGNVVIPAFAVGRTQELLYAIREIKARGLTRFPHFPVYVDSPLAIEATQIFSKCDISCFDREARALLERGIDPIQFEDLHLAVTADESRFINTDPTPKVIISASGMCEAGRVRHHLKHNLWQEKNLILFVGYQGVNTLGRAIADGAKRVRLFGEEIAVRARIKSLRGTSGHADKEGLKRWLFQFEQKPRTVFLNHGDEESIAAFSAELREHGYAVETPFSGTEYDLASGAMTAYTERRPIERKGSAARTRQSTVHQGLVAAAEALLALCKRIAGRPNKEQAKLTAQIRSLIDKYDK
ncbi:MAG: MBL fold metallo-hydrolase [Ruminococcaceae bacterium]|nr:MBL fold metallo-hydrolase [Oscillospiraceae bacterium]